MITRLTPTHYPNTRPLFTDPAAYNVAIDSTLDGTTPGTVWADDPHTPRAALIDTVEGWALGGDPVDEANVNEWARFLREELFPTDDGEELDLRLSPAWERWIDHLAARIERRTILWPRRHYICTQLALTDWAARLPPGFSAHPVDAAFLARADRGEITVPTHTIGWTENNWGSRENYLAHGFGMVIIDDSTNEVVSWSIADCASGTRCEIGIHTHPDYRRRGLASLTSAAAVDHALTHGYTEVGWHCDEQNLGSISTAEKVGFILERKYTSAVYMGNPGSHLTLEAYRHLLDGNPQAAVEAHTRAVALRDDYPYWVYLSAARAYAALADIDSAFEALHRAADLGEPRIVLLNEAPEFATLRGHPEWDRVVGRIRKNGG